MKRFIMVLIGEFMIMVAGGILGYTLGEDIGFKKGKEEGFYAGKTHEILENIKKELDKKDKNYFNNTKEDNNK